MITINFADFFERIHQFAVDGLLLHFGYFGPHPPVDASDLEDYPRFGAENPFPPPVCQGKRTAVRRHSQLRIYIARPGVCGSVLRYRCLVSAEEGTFLTWFPEMFIN